MSQHPVTRRGRACYRDCISPGRRARGRVKKETKSAVRNAVTRFRSRIGRPTPQNSDRARAKRLRPEALGMGDFLREPLEMEGLFRDRESLRARGVNHIGW